MKSTPLFTDNENLSEEAFLRRELNFTLIKVNPVDSKTVASLRRHETISIATTDPTPWEHLFSQMNEKSVVIFLLGNETYSYEKYSWLARYRCFKRVYIYGFPEFGRIRFALGGAMGETVDQRRFIPTIQTLRNLKTGVLKLEGFRDFRLPFPISSFPQGYSQAFESQIFRKIPSLQPQESLVFSQKVKDLFSSSKNYLFGFVGQLGSTRRQEVVKTCSKYGPGIFSFRDAYAGNRKDIDDLYITMLISSKVCLIPPGAFNSLNHRYLEAIIANCIPLTVANVATDPFMNGNWSRKLSLGPRYSYNRLIDYCSKMDDLEVDILVKNLKHSVELDMARTLSSISEVVSS